MNLLIAQRYQIQQILGSGGMGIVYLGVDTQSQKPVAIKQLKDEIAKPDMLERFLREGQALRDLNHPNIVKLLDALAHDGHHYLVMEYVAGGDLKQVLQKKQLTVEQILKLSIDLADALTRAHKLNIIHRDLKPANVLIGDDGILRLTDFGVALVVNQDRITGTDGVVGTLDYLSPEALAGKTLDPRTDIWAFGVMLFEMLAGELPFKGQFAAQKVMAVLNQPIPDLQALCPHAPVALVDLIYRMLTRDPQARISSVRHVGAELEDILEGRDVTPIPTRFETPVPEFQHRPKHNLPAQTTPFVGREQELQELARLIENPNTRLISILAQGGMGKTRLSLALAEQQISHFENGVYFVELAPLSNVEDIVPTIADALNYQFQNDGRESKQQLFDFLKEKKLLLVLDNFEELLAGAGLVSELLKAAPQVKIVVTSRQRLEQAGEMLFHLSGMNFPKWETPADALEYAAVKLFMNSAKLANPSFELAQDNLDLVARICKLVQGMPLGIVLAASWLGMLSPQEIVTELQNSLDFLATDSGQLPERQRSMRAVMDYSWQQMSEDEQAVFAKLSVFRGGFTRESAESVAGATLRILMSLVNKSLLRRNSDNGRYEIHELLRQYGESILQAQGVADATRQDHSQYFVSFVETATTHLRLAKQEYYYQALEDDLDNIRSALDWAFDSGQIDLAVRFAIALHDFWFYQSYHREAMRWIEKLLPLVDPIAPALKGRFYTLAGNFYWITLNRSEGAKYLPLGLAVLRTTDHKRYIGWALTYYFAMLGLEEKSVATAMSYAEEALAIFREIDDRAGQAQLYNMIGNTYEFQKDYEKSIAAFTQSREISRENGEMRRVSMMNTNLAKQYLEMGQFEKVIGLVKQGVELAVKIKFTYILIMNFASFARILARFGHWYESVQFLSFFTEQSKLRGTTIQPMHQKWLSELYEEVRLHLDDKTYQEAWQSGIEMPFDRGVQIILNWPENP